MSKPVSFLDKMPEAERKQAVERADRRLERQQSKKGLDVPPMFFMAAELGYYYGWDALMAFRRGYTRDMNGDKELFTMQEATLLLEAAQKVWYKKLTEQAHAGVIGNSFTVKGSYDEALKPFEEMSK